MKKVPKEEDEDSDKYIGKKEYTQCSVVSEVLTNLLKVPSQKEEMQRSHISC